MFTTPLDAGFGSGADDAIVAREQNDRDHRDDAAAIDQALRLVADHHAATGSLLGRTAPRPTLAELRRSPLGQDLRLLAGASKGTSSETVQAAATRVLDLLLRPLAADDRTVPAWFWATGLGRMVARAERAAHGPGGLLTLDETADRLDTKPATVEGWLADGAIRSVPDEDGRPLLPRATVERRRLVALDLAGVPSCTNDVLLAERPLAS